MCKHPGVVIRRNILAVLPVTGSPNEIEAKLLGVIDDTLRELASEAT